MLLRSTASTPASTAARRAPHVAVHRVCVTTGARAHCGLPARTAGVPHSGLHLTSSPSVTARASRAGSTTSTNVETLRAEIQALEAERDTAVKTGEGCAQTATKLAEMASLLEKVAIEKMRGGDTEGARMAIKEKQTAVEVLDKNAAKADANYKLAAVLSTRIAAKQAALLAALRPGGPGASAASAPAPPPSPASTFSSQAAFTSSEQRPGPASYASYAAGAGASSTTGSADGPKWKWQQSLEEARARLAQQEADAVKEGRWAKLSAESSIAEAKRRISLQAASSVAEAQARLREADASYAGTLEAAQARLRSRDQETLEYVRRIMARYRAGEYVSEQELEFAFQQLERRFTA